ncbi:MULTISPECIES: FtsW/RodA/SpoVE family cell cycle protein [Sphingobacterium]|uniref:Probable peptidoglycan glycosyltransferase FtsW n=1 Tax=Sphingobacterium cellulitidis TaxID=1768011 RepID=A0A8H9KVM0_9SPHI|nr:MULTISPECIES: FtsW/RodA/SpoVE family cell cycle protein [Sphingobacterium]MBA8988462.1 cell division protein FtsW [Sphingobacterium soli]OYD43300.1 cell division protein FtsW [Sphingobacterium cellulitidis]OYD47363.1 cell division protein FtsW [Sphingobacterium cellulitidis]WFB62695.1 FtsW/RodA/SpoVE family cell cycle protein [Sphingobacterium sp. WM]GGE32622.1 cell division protein FtsW [Sphingobacterium soli]
MEYIFSKLKGDKWIWIIVILLSIWSLLAVYSSVGTLAYKEGKGTELYLFKHLFIVVAGLVMMYLSHKLDYRYYAGISKLLMVITIPLLLYTLLFGSKVNEASRWLTIPVINQTFQTSDLAKLALITFLARMLSRKQEEIKDVKKSFIPIMGAVCFVFVLIAWANLSTALMLFGVSVLLLLIGRISFKQIAVVCLGGGVLLMLVIFLGPRRATYMSRVQGFFTTEEVHDGKTSFQDDKNYQANNAKIAIATGEMFGKGVGNSVQRNVLPHPYSDFIFAIIIEEYGTIGGAVLLFLYIALMYRCIRIVTLSPRAFGAFLAAGLGFSLTIQALANMAVAVGLGPVTGVPLPLVSMGGTSILFTSVALGIILSVSRNVEELKVKEDKVVEKAPRKVVVGTI